MTSEELDKLLTYTMESPRNYLNEAFAILRGETMMLATREHLEAMAAKIAELSAKLEP